MSGIERQCLRFRLPVETLRARNLVDAGGRTKWVSRSGQSIEPELLAIEHYASNGWCGSWCEGGTLNLTMKSAALPFLIKHNSFGNPTDAITRYFEAQCTILRDRHEELLAQVQQTTRGQMRSMAKRLLADTFVRDAYPRVTVSGILALWEALGRQTFVKITATFLTDPYRFRAGWPDLTLVRDNSVRFVEIKTTDTLRAAQIAIVEYFAHPIGLDFRVCHVVHSQDEKTGIAARPVNSTESPSIKQHKTVLSRLLKVWGLR